LYVCPAYVRLPYVIDPESPPIVYVAEATELVVMPLLTAIAFKVLDEPTVIGPVNVADDVVGVVPSVVT
jgi:hypothetical protein